MWHLQIGPWISFCLRDKHDRYYKLAVHPVEGGDTREARLVKLTSICLRICCLFSPVVFTWNLSLSLLETWGLKEMEVYGPFGTDLAKCPKGT